MIRLLLIEDDPVRIALFREWLPCDVRLVVATSAGKAIGILQRDRDRVYAGILLDHDLQEQIVTSTDRLFSGSDIVKIIARNISRETPILIHSMNISRAPLMAEALESEGFVVARVPMSILTKNDFVEWVEEAREMWEDFQDE
jgi:CheY-like chemotaxis protein